MTEDKSARYHRLRRRASALATLTAALLLILLVASGAAVRLRAAAQAVAGTVVPAGADEAATVVLITLAIGTLLAIVELPFAWYQGHVLEHRYGLSTQSATMWLRDHTKAAVLGAVVTTVGASVVYAAIRQWPAAWWLASGLVFTAAAALVVRLAPVLLLPLFYRFRPLERPGLTARLLALASRAGTDVVGVFEWELSGHTRKANAALAGLGATRRILVSDTLLSDYSEDEIEVILAHELAHHVHRDLWRGLAIQAAVIVAGFLAASVVLGTTSERLGYAGLADPASLPLLLLVGGAWLMLTLPLVNAASRAQERAADRYALEATRNPEAFISAMRRLAQQNLAEDEPSPVVRALFHSHPLIRERIAAARAFSAS